MSVIATIKKANAEYEQNGRSEQFVAFEDGIVKSKNMVHIYWFARYVKGADIGKLQSIILRNGSMEDCFYFVKYVRGANIKLFLNRAINEGDKFWVQRIALLATSPFNSRKNEIEEFKYDLEEYGIKLEDQSNIAGLKREDINNMIPHANEEFEQYGRTKKFEEYERKAIFSAGEGADIFIFALNVPGANIKKLQRAVLLHGSPLDIFLFAQEIDGTDKQAMLSGLKLVQYDYVTIEEKEKKRLDKVYTYRKQVEQLIEENADNRVIAAIKRRLYQAEAAEPHLSMVRDYHRQVEAMVARGANNK